MSTPTISLIIPTRERADTLRFALRSAVENESKQLEIIVSDNDSRDETRDVVESFRDSRIKYVNPGRRLPMCDNWEFALSSASGRFVVFIGDDDAVLPRGLDRLEAVMSQTSYRVFQWPKHVYVWPFPGQEAYAEHVAEAACDRELNLPEIAHHVIARGGWGHYYLPNSYHSAVERTIFDEIRARTGRVFHATQPDVFAGLAIPVFERSALRIGHVITMHGRSRKANGGAAVRAHKSESLDRFLCEYQGYRLHPTLFPAVEPRLNITPDTMLRVIELFPEFYSRVSFDYSAMWSYLCREAPMVQSSLTTRFVLRNRNEIRKFHEFSTSRFLFVQGVTELTKRRRELITRYSRPLSDRFEVIPDNIAEFAKLCAVTLE